MKTNVNINLSFEPNSAKNPKIVCSKQFDNLTRTLKVRLGAKVPVDSVVVLRGTKSDSTVFELVGERLNDSEYLFQFTESSLSVAGRMVCEVVCTNFENGIAKTCSTEIFFVENVSSAVTLDKKELDDSAKTIPLIVENALSDAKESGEFNGKSAYQYAVEGGYVGSEEDFARKLAEENSFDGVFANPLENTAFGTIVRADDVLPVSHKIKAKIKSKNLIPLTTTKTVNGITYTVYGNGKIVLNGTSTELSHFSIPFASEGNTYTLSLNNPEILDSSSATFIVYSKTGRPVCTTYADTANKVATFTVGDEITSFDMRIPIGVTLSDFEIKPQLEIGNVATPFTSNIEAANEQICVYGKNILPNTTVEQVSNGFTATPNADGTITITGASGGTAEKIFFELALLGANGAKENVYLKAGKNYILSVWKNGEIAGGIYKTQIYYPDKNEIVTTNSLGDKTRDRVLTQIYVERTLVAGNTSLNGVYALQIEMSDERTDYASYKKAEYVSDENGALTFPSVSPILTAEAKNQGATVEIAYLQDTNTVINRIKEALESLGADV